MAYIGYYNGFDVKTIDADGVSAPVALATLDIIEVATGLPLGTAVTDDFGYLEAATVTSGTLADGSEIEFSNASYPNSFRRTVMDTLAKAWALTANFQASFVAEDLSTARTAAAVETWLIDLSNPDSKPVRLGFAPTGAMTPFKYETLTASRNLRVRTNPVTDKLERKFLRLEDAPSTDFVAAATLVAGVGSVTSVAMSVPSALLAVSGSPITSSGTFAVTLPTRTANQVFAGPTGGGAATPTFRALVAADIPQIPISTGISGLGANVATWLATPTSTNLRTAVAATSTGTGSLVFHTAPELSGNVKGGTFNADGGTNPGGTFFYVSTNQNLSSIVSAANLYVNNLHPSNNGLYGVLAEARQGVNRTGLNGNLYGGKFTANVAGDAQTAYGLWGRLSVDAGKTATEAGAVLFGTTINGSVTTFSGLKQELINGGTVTDFYGTYTNIQNNASSTITNPTGLRVTILNNGNTITTAKGITFDGYGGSGGITNNYLIYAASGTAVGTNRWGLHFLPDMPSHHVGKFGLGSGNTAPACRLTVRDTSDQFRIENSGSVYANFSVTATTGELTIDCVGSAPQITFADNVKLSDKDLVLGTATGTKIGTSTSQKIGFWNATPIAQPASANQAAAATTAATNVTPYGYTTQAQADAIITLLNEIRSVLVAEGLMKGSA